MNVPARIKERLRWSLLKRYAAQWFLVPFLTQEQRRRYIRTADPVRYAALGLAFGQINQEAIQGSLAECGVYKGALSAFIHEHFPDRPLYLFDTFRGFDERDLGGGADGRFSDTSVDTVLRTIGDSVNIHIREGYFPETTAGLENERFAFVMVDFDKYEPTLAALRFFYPRMNRGGILCVHDYSSPESDRACAKALDLFLADKPERPILLPDSWGSALIRKT